MICGPSNSGKSTLSVALARQLDTQAVHLDLLHHLPNTNWQPRPPHEFQALHAKAVEADRWVIEGYYFALLPRRLERATGVILLGSDRWSSLFRYLRRTLSDRPRAGDLEGAKDRISAQMLHFILFEQPRKRERNRTLLRGAHLPMVETSSLQELRALYRAWGLTLPRA
jgi:adenylate kinase family enzyme